MSGLVERRTYLVRLITPAFIGNAEQEGQWRTPPFKALMRQWWRVAYAAEHGFEFDVRAMRREEGRLFGHAWLEDDRDGTGRKVAARKSLLRVRLAPPGGDGPEAWGRGTQRGVSPLRTAPETSFAWFGLANRGSGLADRTGIRSAAGKGTSEEGVRLLHLAFPMEMAVRMEEVIRLIAAFGSVGSRSRGGWGALHIEGLEPLCVRTLADRHARRIKECLHHDWAMSLAWDDEHGAWMWESKAAFGKWDEAMAWAAVERKRVRGGLRRVGGKDLRAALGFATRRGRMASPLRWKVVLRGKGKLAVRAFAMPHSLPKDSGESMGEEELAQAWDIVRKSMDDKASPFTRVAPRPAGR